MSVIKFEVVGQPSSYFNNLVLTHIDSKKLAQYLDSKSKLVNGQWKLKASGLRGWSGVNDSFCFTFSNRGWLNSFRNKLVKDVA